MKVEISFNVELNDALIDALTLHMENIGRGMSADDRADIGIDEALTALQKGTFTIYAIEALRDMLQLRAGFSATGSDARDWASGNGYFTGWDNATEAERRIIASNEK